MNPRHFRRSQASVAAGAMALAIAGFADGSIVFTGSGLNPEAGATASGSAAFTITGSTLTVVLTNTTALPTASQGNALTGFAFGLTGGSASLSLTNLALTSGSSIWTSELASNTSDPLAGSWTTVLGATPLGPYGASTSGFNGAFNGGSISLGNSSPNYGIVAAGTFNGSNVSFGGSQFPFIQNSLTFTFTGIGGFTESQIANVKLCFGTDGTGLISTVPAPGSIALLGLAGLGGRRRRMG